MNHIMRNCLNKKGKNEFWMNDGYMAYKKENGPHFTCKLADWASAKMVNSDGTNHLWTSEQVKDAVKSLGYDLIGSYTWGDVAYAANMYYSDFRKVLPTDVDAVKMAILAMKDPDGYEGMIFNRFTADIMEKGVCVPWHDVM